MVWVTAMRQATFVFLALLGIYGVVNLYFVAVMVIFDLLAMLFLPKAYVYCKYGDSKHRRSELEWLWFVKIGVQYLLTSMTVFFGNNVATYLVGAIAMAITAISSLYTIIMSMVADDQDWLNPRPTTWLELPNWISLCRFSAVLIVPSILVMQPFGYVSNLVALVILIVGVLADLVDGYIARRDDKVTKIGKILDPVCDKITFYPILVALLIKTRGELLLPRAFENIWVLIVVIFVAATVLRDAGFISVYVWKVLLKKRRVSVQANFLDKLRMVMMSGWMFAEVFALVCEHIAVGVIFSWLSFGFVIAVIASSILSIMQGLRTPLESHGIS